LTLVTDLRISASLSQKKGSFIRIVPERQNANAIQFKVEAMDVTCHCFCPEDKEQQHSNSN